MKYYIGHIHEVGKEVDRIYVQDLATYKMVVEENILNDKSESRINELKSVYPESNILHFVY